MLKWKKVKKPWRSASLRDTYDNSVISKDDVWEFRIVQLRRAVGEVYGLFVSCKDVEIDIFECNSIEEAKELSEKKFIKLKNLYDSLLPLKWVDNKNVSSARFKGTGASFFIVYDIVSSKYLLGIRELGWTNQEELYLGKTIEELKEKAKGEHLKMFIEMKDNYYRHLEEANILKDQIKKCCIKQERSNA